MKWFGSERTLWVTRTAVQVHGGYGVVQEYDVERHYRNALILPDLRGDQPDPGADVAEGPGEVGAAAALARC